MDINTLTWAKEIGDVISVDLDAYLSPLFAVDDIIGTVTQEAALATGLPMGRRSFCGCTTHSTPTLWRCTRTLTAA